MPILRAEVPLPDPRPPEPPPLPDPEPPIPEPEPVPRAALTAGEPQAAIVAAC
jgi:hypothetical protein